MTPNSSLSLFLCHLANANSVPGVDPNSAISYLSHQATNRILPHIQRFHEQLVEPGDGTYLLQCKGEFPLQICRLLNAFWRWRLNVHFPGENHRLDDVHEQIAREVWMYRRCDASGVQKLNYQKLLDQIPRIIFPNNLRY